LIRLLAAAAGRPTVLHCAAGKDRTGLVTALTLRLLGVGDEHIVADYLATEQNMPRIIERFSGWPRYRDHMATVPAEVYQAQEYTIRAFLQRVDELYGGARGWARTRGLDRAVLDQLVQGLTEPS
jgi:protein-tyrosine phosphatase